MEETEAKSQWAVTFDDGSLEVVQLSYIIRICRKHFTELEPRVVHLPILSLWPTMEEAQKDIESLRSFEKKWRKNNSDA